MTVNVRDFGALGDGVSNDGPSVKKAIAHLEKVGGGVLYFPTGNYRTDIKHTVSGFPCHIRGDGSELTKVIWGTPDGGFEFTTAQRRPVFKVTEISLLSSSRWGGTALRAKYGGGAKEHNLEIRDVEIRGVDANSMWTFGIFMCNACQASLRNIRFKGVDTNDWSDADREKDSCAIRIDTSEKSSGYFLSEISLFECKIGLHATGHNDITPEGIHLTSFEFVGTIIGIKLNNVGNSVTIGSGHFDHSRSALICRQTSQISVSNIWAKTHQATGVYAGNFMEFNECRVVSISNCKLVWHAGNVAQGQESNGITAERLSDGNPIGMIITGNTFTNIPGVSIWLPSTEDRDAVHSNLFPGCEQPTTRYT
jgi:pectate lyase-like protein